MTLSTPSAGRRFLDQYLGNPVGFASFVRLVRSINRRQPGILPLDEHLQESTRRALVSADSFAGNTDEQLLGWLRVVARRVLTDAIRARRPTEPLPSDLVEPIPLDDSVESADETSRVMSLLEQFSTADRAILLARFRDGLQPRHIARITGLSGDTLRQRLSRLLKALRAKLDG